MDESFEALQQALEAATGADRELDRRVVEAFANQDFEAEGELPAYSASVDSCLELISRVLPHWAWHIGYGPRGIFPYAALHDDAQHFEALAPTVPLALLNALVKVRVAQKTSNDPG